MYKATIAELVERRYLRPDSDGNVSIWHFIGGMLRGAFDGFVCGIAGGIMLVLPFNLVVYPIVHGWFTLDGEIHPLVIVSLLSNIALFLIYLGCVLPLENPKRTLYKVCSIWSAFYRDITPVVRINPPEEK